jgi:hypothetical protein
MTNTGLPPIQSPSLPPRITSQTSVAEETKDAIYELVSIQREQSRDLKEIRQSTGCLFILVLVVALIGGAGFACAAMTYISS